MFRVWVFCYFTQVMYWKSYVCVKEREGNIPVCSSLGMVGGAVLMDRPDRESSRPGGKTGAVGGGVTAEGGYGRVFFFFFFF